MLWRISQSNFNRAGEGGRAIADKREQPISFNIQRYHIIVTVSVDVGRLDIDQRAARVDFSHCVTRQQIAGVDGDAFTGLVGDKDFKNAIAIDVADGHRLRGAPCL